MTRSANRGRYWISELQGSSDDIAQLSRWYWSCFARGAKAVIAWQWRSEVFGREAGSFGIWGRHDNTAQRLSLYHQIGDMIKQHGQLLDEYQPDMSEVALFHDPNTFNLEWAATGDTQESVYNLKGWSAVLENSRIPYSFMDSGYLDNLSQYKLIIMGRPLIVPQISTEKILEFVRDGGTLLIEGNADAFTSAGFFQYGGEERPFAYRLGIDYRAEISISGKKPSYCLSKPGEPPEEEKIREEIKIEYSGHIFNVFAEGSITPLMPSENDEILAYDNNGLPFASSKMIGKGKVIALAGFLGKAYHRACNHKGLESFIQLLAYQAGVFRSVTVQGGDVFWHTGLANNKRILFLINAGMAAEISVEITNNPSMTSLAVYDLMNNQYIDTDECNDFWKFKLEIEYGETRILTL